MNTPTLLRTKDAAAHIGVRPPTLIEWAQKRPEIRACKFARGWWRVAELDRAVGSAK